jgi:transcriptional regulator with XRE-family HTH domain
LQYRNNGNIAVSISNCKSAIRYFLGDFMKGSFNAAAFFAALDSQRAASRLTWKQVAEQSGVSASTLTRMAQGKRPDIDGLAALAKWSGLAVDRFVGKRETAAEPLAEMTAILHGDPRLSSQSKAALEHMLKAAYEQLRDDRS